MADEIVRTDKEIEKVMDKVYKSDNEGSAYPGQSYEDGIRAMYLWLTGQTEDNPFED